MTEDLGPIDCAITETLDDCARRLHVAAVVGSVLTWFAERMIRFGWTDEEILRLVRQVLDDARLARRKGAN